MSLVINKNSHYALYGISRFIKLINAFQIEIRSERVVQLNPIYNVSN